MTNQLESLSNCLFNAFANRHFYNPQDDQHLWAIYEGLRRIDLRSFNWEALNARKEHECVRRCRIKPGEIYFKNKVGGGYSGYLKLCAGCMAMVLYFMNIEEYAPQMYTHWDIVDERPIKIKADAE